MYPRTYIIPNNSQSMYKNMNHNNSGDRVFLAPFLFGGLAGTALGFGIANNNQINRPIYVPYPPYRPMPYYNHYGFNTYGYNQF